MLLKAMALTLLIIALAALALAMALRAIRRELESGAWGESWRNNSWIN
jgi:hypothetical protein